MYINPECAKSIMLAIHTELQNRSSGSHAKPAKVRSVLESDILTAYSYEQIQIAYNFLLDCNYLSLHIPSDTPATVMRGPGSSTYKFAASKHSYKSVRQSDIRQHKINRITTSGYEFLESCENVPLWKKISLPNIFDTACQMLTAGKTVAELIAFFLA